MSQASNAWDTASLRSAEKGPGQPRGGWPTGSPPKKKPPEAPKASGTGANTPASFAFKPVHAPQNLRSPPKPSPYISQKNIIA